MQKSMTLSGKLEEAVGVKRELAGIHGETEKPLALGGGDSELAKELIGTSWEIKQSGGTIMAKFGDGMFRVHKQGSDGNYFPGAGRT